MDASKPVLFFDGVCNLCSGAVQFVLKHDRSGEIQFASLQSDLAADVLPAHGLDPAALDSLVLLEGGKVYTQSQGALRTAELMGGSVGAGARVAGWIPRRLRDWVYRLIARNRYRTFGKKEQCWLPRPEWRARFVG